MDFYKQTYFIFCIISLFSENIFSQSSHSSSYIVTKPAIDSAAVHNYVMLDDDPATASADGKYMFYGMTNVCLEARWILQSTQGGWKRQVGKNISGGVFSSDSREFIYQSGDTLFLQELGSDKLKSILHIKSFKLLQAKTKNRNEDWLIWQSGDSKGELVLQNLSTGKERRIPSVSEYSVSADEKMLLIKSVTESTNGREESLSLLTIPDGDPELIWSNRGGERLGSTSMDASGSQVVFMVNRPEAEDKIVSSIWYYKKGMGKAIEKVNDHSTGIDQGLVVDNNMGVWFSGDGRYIYFNLRGPELKKAPKSAESVDVWSYRDAVLQSDQMKHLQPLSYQSVIAVDRSTVVRFEKEFERSVTRSESADYVFISHDTRGDRFWIKDEHYYELVSLKDGSRKTIESDRMLEGNCWFSPGGRYFIFYKYDNYYSYYLETGKEVNISRGIPKGWLSVYLQDCDSTNDPNLIYPLGITGWLKNERGVLVYDDYDIWLLDPSGKKPPVNVTNSYGRKNHIKFKLIAEKSNSVTALSNDSEMLLTAENNDTKYNGFYRFKINKAGDPQLLTMGPWRLNIIGDQFHFDIGMPPVRAGRGWIVRRSTATEPPNYYYTDNDFKSLRKLTDLDPLKGYKWITSELVNYPQLDGTMTQGILYKPDDFDPDKKYPVIIEYYERFSQRMYEYPNPDLIGHAELNIPWFVTRDYLIFTVDIHNHFCKQGETAQNSVEGAGLYLSKLSYVDGKRIGISGHSHGGAETNYLVTHTHLFAAAFSGSASQSGVDLISQSLTLEGGLDVIERQHFGASLWARPDLWIKNSPLFQADQVTTPFLIMNNKADVEWERNVEFFIGLRRLGKKVWMLQYDNGNHSLYSESDKKDLTIRVEQFFGHYLKGEPPAKWMTEGVPAKLKGIDTGLELDYSGKQP